MAPSSLFNSSPELPDSSTSHHNSKPTPIVTFSSRPLQRNKEQQLLLAKAKRRRQQRALRMSREKQIPALTLHCASQLHTVSCLKETPLRFSMHKSNRPNMEGDFSQVGRDASSILGSSPGGAIVVYDGRVSNSRMLKPTRSFSECSGGDGDVSDVGSDRGPDLFEFRNWQNESSSSPSSSTYESPLNVSKALSECSYEGRLNSTQAATSACLSDDGTPELPSSKIDNKIDEKEDKLSVEYWKLQVDVLAAECKLLRLEKELAIRRWTQECMNNGVSCPRNATVEPGSKDEKKKSNAFKVALYSSRTSPCQHYAHENWAEESSQDASKKLHDMSYPSNCFTQEALRRIEEVSHKRSSRKVPLEDPTEALQKRLQGLLLAAQTSALEPEGQMDSISDLGFHDSWEYTNLSGKGRATRESMVNPRCFAETAALKKRLDFMSLELSETKDAAAFIRKEYRSMLSEEKGLQSGRDADQVVGEEMYCRAAIRQIVAQVQAENEQWSQVQDILRSLQEEMKILIETRDLSDKRAARAEAQLLSLKKTVHDWRCRARSAEEEVMMLRSERELLRLRIQNMKQKHAAERRSWFEEGNAPREAVALAHTDTQPRVVATLDVEEQPRLANVGTQEDYALCESIVHSRNESSRSSVDLGTTSQRRIQRTIKKSLDFSNSSNEGNVSKSRVRSHRFTDQIRKIEPTRLDFCSKTSDVNSGARHKINGLQPKVELTSLECVEPVFMTEYKERKKARLFTFKENRSISGPIEMHAPFSAQPLLQRSSLGHVMIATQDLLDHVVSSKSKSSLPSAPTSTPSRLPFGEIFNSPSSR